MHRIYVTMLFSVMENIERKVTESHMHMHKDMRGGSELAGVLEWPSPQQVGRAGALERRHTQPQDDREPSTHAARGMWAGR